MKSPWEKLIENAESYSKDETKNKISHSFFYHKFFRGYAERKIPGKWCYRIQRFYIEDYYCYQESEAVWWRNKLLYGLLYLVCLGMLLWSQTYPDSSLNYDSLLGKIQVLGLLPMTFFGFEVLMQILAKRKMTIDEYASASKGMQTAAGIEMFYILGMVIHMSVLLITEGLKMTDAVPVIGHMIAGICAFLIFWLEKHRAWDYVKNEKEMPTDANEIW